MQQRVAIAKAHLVVTAQQMDWCAQYITQGVAQYFRMGTALDGQFKALFIAHKAGTMTIFNDARDERHTLKTKECL